MQSEENVQPTQTFEQIVERGRTIFDQTSLLQTDPFAESRGPVIGVTLLAKETPQVPEAITNEEEAIATFSERASVVNSAGEVIRSFARGGINETELDGMMKSVSAHKFSDTHNQTEGLANVLLLRAFALETSTAASQLANEKKAQSGRRWLGNPLGIAPKPNIKRMSGELSRLEKISERKNTLQAEIDKRDNKAALMKDVAQEERIVARIALGKEAVRRGTISDKSDDYAGVTSAHFSLTEQAEKTAKDALSHAKISDISSSTLQEALSTYEGWFYTLRERGIFGDWAGFNFRRHNFLEPMAQFMKGVDSSSDTLVRRFEHTVPSPVAAPVAQVS